MPRAPRRAFAAIVASLIASLALAAPAARAQESAAPAPAAERPNLFEPISAEDQLARMGRGVNVLGYDPYWDNGPARVQAKHLAAIKAAGFSTVRVVLQAFKHMDSHGVLDPAWLKKLDWVVATASADGLNVIVDEHDFNLCSANVQDCRSALLAFWIQVGSRYRKMPNSVMFELLNEPHDKLTPEAWNSLLVEVLAEVRKKNPERTVIIGPTMWNSLSELKDLQLPEADRNIIVTFHYYTPMEFTHQGATWVGDRIKALHGVTWGTPADLARMNADMDTVKAWAVAHHRPIFLGEFGSYDTIPLEQRAVYERSVARAAEARGFAWAHWEFDTGFKLWDMSKDDWVHPILDALIPEDAGKSPR